MFFNTKIKWTIDTSCSEIFFRLKHLLLDGVNGRTGKIIDNKFCQSEMYIRTEETAASIDYNFVIFEEKNSKQFWKRETFSGLLIFKKSGQNVLITLQHIENIFDECGRASATYYVKGELDHADVDFGIDRICNEACELLQSKLLFEGSIRLIQKD